MAHITDYTTKDLAADIYGMRDLQDDRIIEKATKAIDAAIAQAVAAEREACVKALETLPTESDDEFYTVTAAIAAIRSRSNGATAGWERIR